MKRSSLFTACVAYLFLIMLLAVIGSAPVIAADICDKKPDLPKCNTDPPPDPEPDPDDSCANFSAPDYAFWRESNKGRVPTKTIFVADSTTGCEKELLFIDLSETGFVNRLNLAYSSVGSGESFFGRIVFQMDLGSVSSQAQIDPVWKYDFGISEGQIHPVEGPLVVLTNTDPENSYARGLDLSADTHSLVWNFAERSGDDLSKLSIRTLDIDGCVDWPCASVDEGNNLVEYEYQNRYPDPSTGTLLQNPVWGPFGERIYFVAKEYQPDSHSHYVMAIAADGSANGQATMIFGIENQVPGDANYRHVRSVASGLSGWPDPGEYLAVEIGDDNFVYSCADVYTLDVELCPGPQCELQYELGGNFMTWTRSGAILLTGLGGACKYNQIGIWDGTDVNIITKGYEPEAAASWPD